MIASAMSVVELLDRPTYGITQVDRLLSLRPGTAKRWIDGYVRAGVAYQPVIRPETTGNEAVTWGEFVETRLLSEFRDKGIPMINLRPAVSRLRDELGVRYPLAYAKPYLDVDGRELVRAIQNELDLDAGLWLVTVRSNQLVLTTPADHFRRSVEFAPTADGGSDVAARIHPFPDDGRVVMDPLRRFGQPVVRAVPTDVIAEQFRAGDPIEMISDLYELPSEEIQAAIRYEMARGGSTVQPAA
jgi:uncharacterized protein (DUF433 family)